MDHHARPWVDQLGRSWWITYRAQRQGYLGAALAIVALVATGWRGGAYLAVAGRMNRSGMAKSERRELSAQRLVAIGASAGGVEALTRLVADLPEDLPAAVVVVLHHSPGFPSALAHILAQAGPLPAMEARDGDQLQPGFILVAPPGHHLVVQDGRARFLDTARVNGVKPAIDPLFQSGAREYGPRLVAVILSGMLNDGSAGLIAVRRAGGVAVVQKPSDARFSDMPQNALDAAGADHCVPVGEMASLLVRLARQGT